MEFLSEPLVVALFWGLVLTGAAFVGFGLFRNYSRLSQWNLVRNSHTGEIVLGDRLLKVGLTADIVPASEDETLPGRLLHIAKRDLAFRLERGNSPVRTSRPWPHLGDSVTVTFTQEDALYRFSAKVRDLRSDDAADSSRTLHIARPFWMARVQRRQFFRTGVCLPAAFALTRPDSPEHEKEQPPLHGTVVNLSGGGLCAELGSGMGAGEAGEKAEKLKPGSVVRVRLPIPALPDPVLLRILRCDRAVARGGLTLRVTGEFLPMAQWEQENLVNFLFQEQREQLQSRRESSRSAA